MAKRKFKNIFIGSILPRPYDAIKDKMAMDINIEYQNLCREYDVVFVNHDKVFLSFNSGMIRSYCYGQKYGKTDKHPNPKGSREMAMNIRKTLTTEGIFTINYQ